MSNDTAFLSGGGAATALIEARDWSTHPLGPPASWPDALKVALSLVLNSPESMILCWGEEPLHFFFNEAYFPLLGPRLEWAMGERFDRVWADALDQAMPIVRAAFAGQSERFVDLPWKLDTDRGRADTWWSFSYSRVLDAAGGIAGLFILTTETTDQVLTTRALSRSRTELSVLNADLERRIAERTAERDRLWNTSPDLMVVMNPDGTYRHLNPAWTQLLGWHEDELIGVPAISLVHPDDLAETEVALGITQQGTLAPFENRFRHKDGSYRLISWTAAPGESALFATGRDVTEARERDEALRLAEEQFRQAQKIEAVGQLTGGVAHDFNNFLTVIRGSVDLLRRPHLTEEKRARYVDAIAQTADRATRLTNQLLAFARRQSLTPETFDAAASIASIGDMIRTLIGPRIRLTLPEEATVSRCVSADRGQFDAAIVNLAINGRDAIEGDGAIDVLVGVAASIPAVRGHAAIPGRFVTVTLDDSGTGVPSELAERVFEPFYTTKQVGHGTGLGLSQVIGFVKQSGGDVTVGQSPRGGARFTLYLPQVDPGEPGAAVADLAPAAASLHLRVLVVEDNLEVGSFAEQALAELGYETTLATDATSALALIEQEASRFDVIFSDVVMPGMSGIELAGEIAARHPNLPIVLTSGYSHVLATNTDHGFALLRKPYTLEELAHALERATVARS